MAKRKKIGIVVPVLNYFEGLPDLMLSVKTRHEYMVYVQPQYYQQVPLSRAWNRGMIDAFKDGCDYALVCNDDIMFAPTCIDTMVEEYERLRPEGVIMLTPNNIMGQVNGRYDILSYYMPKDTETSVSEHPNFSCFLVTPEYLETVGYFDENFTPAWYEDNDSHRRAKLLGLREVCSTKCVSVHIGGVTTRLMPNPNSGESQRYFIEKWGGIPETHPVNVQKEHFPTPYNDPSFSVSDWRGNPYKPEEVTT
jgi:hypothetical protein